MSSANENKLKHLEFIQLAITRLNVNSFLVKGWLVTLVAALFVIAQKDTNTTFLWIAPSVAGIFWLLDSYFLWTERRFRELYDVVRKKEESKIDFSMDIKQYKNNLLYFFGMRYISNCRSLLSDNYHRFNIYFKQSK